MLTQTESRIEQTLDKAIKWAHQKEQRLLFDLLELQRKMNHFQDTKPAKKKMVEEQKIELLEEPEGSSKYHKKIESLIEEAENELEILDNPHKKARIMGEREKPKKEETLPIIEKKTPVPTTNRVKEGHAFIPKPNYHYHNKNQVTGKITQMPNFSNKQVKISKKNVSVERPAKITANAKNTSCEKIGQKQKRHSSAQKIRSEKITYVDFQSFQKSFDQMLEECASKRGKYLMKKQQFEKFVNQYDREILGYRQKEEKAALSFLKSFNSLSETRKKLVQEKGLEIDDRSWDGHPIVFRFQEVLLYFKNLLISNPISEEYSLDLKEEYRIKYTNFVINKMFEEDIVTVRQSLKLPPKLGLSFEMNLHQNFDQIGSNINENEQNPYLGDFYEQLAQRLNEIRSLENLDRKSLSNLRSLISICEFGGRRSPVIVTVDKYEDWKDHYHRE